MVVMPSAWRLREAHTAAPRQAALQVHVLAAAAREELKMALVNVNSCF
jgi:hypothetical protein